MQRYFTENMNIKEKIAIIRDDLHHIKNVMRFTLGTPIIVCDLEGHCFSGTISSIEDIVTVQLGHTLPSSELPITVDIAQALIRRERFEYMLQKASELGASSILPVKMKHSIIKLDKTKSTKKVDRWNKITKEASEQSHRHKLVSVSSVISSIQQVPFESYDLVLVAYEKEIASKTLSTINYNNINNILLVIGPEGGFDPSEIDFLSTIQNVQFVGLGKRILRSETASSYLLSVIAYETEMRN